MVVFTSFEDMVADSYILWTSQEAGAGAEVASEREEELSHQGFTNRELCVKF